MTAKKTDNNQLAPLHYLMWFRRDLRIDDNTALTALCEKAKKDHAYVSAVFFITPEQWQQHDTAVTQVDFIMRRLPHLAKALKDDLNITLTVAVCDTFSDCVDVLTQLCLDTHVKCVMANHEYEENEINRDTQLIANLAEHNISVIRHHDQCVLPPASITTGDNTMYKVFTPFYKKWQQHLDVSPIHCHSPCAVNEHTPAPNQSLSDILPKKITHADNKSGIATLIKDVAKDYEDDWQNRDALQHIDIADQLACTRDAYPTDMGAPETRLNDFISDDIDDYDSHRDTPHSHATSRLSAYLTTGMISPRRCYIAAIAHLERKRDNKDSDETDITRWCSELAWRDFYRHVLCDRPELIRHEAYNQKLDKAISWSNDEDSFAAWCSGRTGVPLVDAAMRCLNATGFMHNRLRMVVAMFLTKDLLIDWRWGEKYFVQNLIDGDFASNNGGWQWSASTGTDSAPYFRIMNPFSQGKSHDKDALFIKQWLPELKDVPADVLHSEAKLNKAFGDKDKKEKEKKDKAKQKSKKQDNPYADIDYPAPIVDHKAARRDTIAMFKDSK